MSSFAQGLASTGSGLGLKLKEMQSATKHVTCNKLCAHTVPQCHNKGASRKSSQAHEVEMFRRRTTWSGPLHPFNTIIFTHAESIDNSQ
eukprot:4544016-Amphidinium_carterae.1